VPCTIPAVNAASSNQTTGASSLTLAELLYADPSIARICEKDWVALVRAIAAGDVSALRVLYEKSHAVVFTYLIRLTGNRELTDELIIDVYQDIWCEAPVFNDADGPVLGWIMRQARHSALASRGTPSSPSTVGERPRAQEDHRLQQALATLSVGEREAIEATVLKGLSYSEMATQWQEPVGTIRSRIRSGLAKLHQALTAGGDGA
jgi:RNA polymerase sigma-70 factor (ECF subfamily)